MKRIPIEDAFDLHSFQPRDVVSAVSDYLEEAWRAGYREVRLIHGNEQHDGETEDVAALVDLPTERLLGGHVARRARRRRDLDGRRGPGGRGGQRRVGRRDPEVEHLHRAVGRHLDIRRLEVAVDDAHPMGAGERGGELPAQIDDTRAVQRPSFQQDRQALALHVFHHHERAAVVLDDVVDGGHVRMIDARRHARFADDAIAQIPRRDTRRDQAFQRDRPIEARVAREEDFPHAPAPEPVLHEIGAHPAAGGQQRLVAHARRGRGNPRALHERRHGRGQVGILTVGLNELRAVLRRRPLRGGEHEILDFAPRCLGHRCPPVIP